MRSITVHKSKLTTAIAKIYGRNLQHADDSQLYKLIFDCYDNATRASEISGIHLSRNDDDAVISCIATPENKVDCLRTVAILANIAADRELEKSESALNELLESY